MNNVESKIKGTTYRLIRGNITTANVDAIVNAANSRLAGGGGVDGAIHKAAGPELLLAGKKIVQENGPLSPGQAVITPGFHLKATYVIHTVGPIWRGGGKKEPALLASCYRSSLELASMHGIKAIAFPAISCGVYGYPHDAASHVALSTLFAHGHKADIETISIYLFSDTMFQKWRTQFYQLTDLTLPL